MNEVREDTAKYLVEPAVVDVRDVRLFRNGANQAVRIPREFELPGQQARMWRDGDRLIIEAVRPKHPKGSPAAMLAILDRWAAEGPIEEDFPDINDDDLPPLDDIDLGEPESR